MRNKGEIWACDPKDPSKRFSLKEELVGEKIRFVKENTEIDLVIFTDEDEEEKIIGIEVPIKVELLVKDVRKRMKEVVAESASE